MTVFGDHHPLTIGRDAATAATQLQIFDVSDLTTPKLAHAVTPAPPGSDYSYSEAEYDHHAFTYDEKNKLLAIPLSYWNDSRGDYFNGIATFKVDVAAGIDEGVRVDHGDLATQAYCGAAASITACNYLYAANPRRSVFMTADSGVTLYTVSDAGVKTTDLAPPNDTLGAVVFPHDLLPPIVFGPPDVIAQ